METLLPAQPESYQRLLNRSLHIYKWAFPKIFLFSLLLAVVAFIPRLVSASMGTDIFLAIPFFDIRRLSLILIDLLSIILFLAILWRVNSIASGFYDSTKEDFQLAFKKIPAVFIAVILQMAIVITLGLALAGIGYFINKNLFLFAPSFKLTFFTAGIFVIQLIISVYLFVLFYFYSPLITIENKGIVSSLQKSARLVYGHWWRTVKLQFTPWATYLFILIVIKYGLNIPVHIYFVELGPQSFGAILLQILLLALLIPWIAAVLLVQLRDLELRRHATLRAMGHIHAKNT